MDALFGLEAMALFVRVCCFVCLLVGFPYSLVLFSGVWGVAGFGGLFVNCIVNASILQIFFPRTGFLFEGGFVFSCNFFWSHFFVVLVA